MVHKYVLGQPEVVIGQSVNKFEWREEKLFFPDTKGILVPVEGEFLLYFNSLFHVDT